MKDTDPQTITNLNICPSCGGDADNGFDREYPPNPYFCKKCIINGELVTSSDEPLFTKITSCYGSFTHGVWWFRVMGYGLMIKAPWDKPLFFERYGRRKILKLFGWRIGCLMP